MKQKIILLTLMLMLAACAGKSEAVRYYQLPDSAFEMPQTVQTALQIELAAPLNRQGLVYQINEYQINITQKNLWASPLENSIAAALANKLNRLGGRYAPVMRNEIKPQLLHVYFDRFQGNHGGYTEIAGYALFPNGQKQSFNIQTIQQSDGYPAMIESFHQGLEKLAQVLIAHAAN